jgi:hypothetical protein
MTDIQCHTCRATVAGYDTIHYGSIETGYRDLCSRCFNTEMARSAQFEFQHVGFPPIEMPDASGALHRFHFRLHLLGDQISLEAFELEEGAPEGYQFQMLADPEADLFGLMGQLLERIRRTLAQQHLEHEPGMGLSIKDFVVRGRIAWSSAQDGRLPSLVIDGRQVSWEQFGRMLMSFEGWQFKLEIKDRSEEI